MTKKRRPAGTPTGGQFAASGHTESDASLDYETSSRPAGVVTADGKTANVGDQVFNYYDGHWGTITSEPDADGWFDVARTDGRTVYLNGERISTEQLGPWRGVELPRPSQSTRLVGVDGEMMWVGTDDRPHRDDGPAIIRPDGTEEWWQHGSKVAPPGFEVAPDLPPPTSGT